MIRAIGGWIRGGGSVTRSLRTGVSMLALLGVATALGACVDDGGPFARENNVLYDEALIVPDHITPPIRVLAVEGAPEHWHLSERVASALRERDIPAGTEGQSGASYLLKGKLEVPQENDGRLRIGWQLVDNAGNAVGEVMQMTAITNATWGTRETGELGMMSQSAAESLAPLVPSSALGETQFAEQTGEPAPPDAGNRRFGPVTAMARRADLGGGSLGDRFVGLADVDDVPTLPNAAEALGIEPDDVEAARADEEAKHRADLPAARMPDLPAADRVPGPAYNIPSSTFGIRPAPADIGGPAEHDPSSAGTGSTTSADTTTSGGRPARDEHAALAAARNGSAAERVGSAASSAAPSDKRQARAKDGQGGLAPYWVQLGDYRSAEESETAWRDLNDDHPKLLDGKPHAIHKAEGATYRVKLGPFVARDAALDNCAGLSRAGVECYITRDPVSFVANAGQGADTRPQSPPKATAPTMAAEKPKALEGGTGSRAPENAGDPPSLPAVPAKPVFSVADPAPTSLKTRTPAPADMQATRIDPPEHVGSGESGPRLRGYIGLPGVTD